MQICYKAKSRKTAGMEINAEKSMQQVTEKNQDKGRIRPCNEVLLRLILIVIVKVLVCNSPS